jgi:hypothetical protein
MHASWHKQVDMPIAEGLEGLVELAKYCKMWWVENDNRGDVPPVVLPVKNKQILAAIFAPKVDKQYGLHAASILRVGLDADAIYLIMDAHMRSMKPEDEKEFLKKYRHGDMQRACDEEGACETGLITDCLMAQVIDSDLRIKMANIPYSYHGKGTTFQWKDKDTVVFDERKAGCSLSGNVPNALRQIMQQKPLSETDELKAAAQKFNFSTNRKMYHMCRGVFRFLLSQNYSIIDYITPVLEDKINQEQ